MSVAFRRDSDEEHKEPRFELPIPPGPNLVTSQGLAQIEARVSTMEAAAGGDDDAKRTLRYWRARLATAQLAPAPPVDEIAFGSIVSIMFNGRARRIAIVGDDEADPASDRIAFSAPLAQALIGGSVGETLPFAGRERAIAIVAIGG